MVGVWPRRRPRGPLRRGKGGRWPEESIYLLTVVAGLALLALSTRTFHKRASERSDARQQLRAAQEGRAARASSNGAAGHDWAVRRGAAGSAGSNVLGSGTAEHLGSGSREEGTRWLQEEPGQGQALPHRSQGAATTLASPHEQVLVRASERGQAASADSNGQHATQHAELQRYCEQHFGLDWLRRWGATARQVCSASRQLSLGNAAHAAGASGVSGSELGSGGSGGGGAWRAPSSVTCRSMNDTHMPAGSAPHVLCDVTNLRLDPSKLHRARCPLHRPGYMCTSPTYHRYAPGAFSVDCAWPGFRLDAFSKDHQQDIFGSFLFQPELGAAKDAEQAPPAAVEELPTLFVTRETKEHANVYHTMTDLLNVYITLRMLGWEQQPRQVIILDAHPPGPLDILWPVAAAGGGPAALALARQLESRGLHPWGARVPTGDSGTGSRLLVRRVEDLQGPALFRRAAFVPPGYTSLLFAHLYEDASCRLPTRLFAAFRRFLLASFGLGKQAAAGGGVLGLNGVHAAAAGAAGSGGAGGGGAGTAGAPLCIRLISRRPGRGKAKMARQIGNEEELLAALHAVAEAWSRGGSRSTSGGATFQSPSVSVSLLDFADLAVEQQLAVVQQTDILVGMHGAALAHALLLPPHAALVELWPQADGIWRCYQNFAQWAGALYRRVANQDPSRHRNTPQGDVTDIDAAELAQAVRELPPLVAARRAAGRRSSELGAAGAELRQEEGEEL